MQLEHKNTSILQYSSDRNKKYQMLDLIKVGKELEIAC